MEQGGWTIDLDVDMKYVELVKVRIEDCAEIYKITFIILILSFNKVYIYILLHTNSSTTGLATVQNQILNMLLIPSDNLQNDLKTPPSR